MEKKSFDITETKVKDIMTKEIVTIDANEKVGIASKLMLKNEIHALIIIENEKPIHIITDYDLLGVIYYARFSEDTSFMDITVNELVEDQVLFSIKPDMSVYEAMKTLVKNNYRIAPVIENDELLGVFTLKDIANYLSS